MKNKVVIITGANSGMGKVTAIELAKKQATIVMVCRNKQLGEAAKAEIVSVSGNKNIDLLIGDLSSQGSIRELAKEIKEKYPQIDVLVNNAGLAFSNYQTSVDNVEMTFAVNHIGYFLLTNLLLDNLKAAPKARIVNIASSTHTGAKMNFEDIGHKQKYTLFGVYNQSKLCNVLFTLDLAKRLKGTNVTVNCLNPGPVKTNLSRDMGAFFKFIGGLFFLTPEKASETAIYLASSPEVETVSGKYFSKKKAIDPSKLSQDETVQKKLWKLSEETVKQKFN
ncbi:MAG: SDR family oxidoreductase [Bacteroidetes bacterium]|nr:SDR family oxidoreductase [Bacteroidota bacterium]